MYLTSMYMTRLLDLVVFHCPELHRIALLGKVSGSIRGGIVLWVGLPCLSRQEGSAGERCGEPRWKTERWARYRYYGMPSAPWPRSKYRGAGSNVEMKGPVRTARSEGAIRGEAQAGSTSVQPGGWRAPMVSCLLGAGKQGCLLGAHPADMTRRAQWRRMWPSCVRVCVLSVLPIGRWAEKRLSKCARAAGTTLIRPAQTNPCPAAPAPWPGSGRRRRVELLIRQAHHPDPATPVDPLLHPLCMCTSTVTTRLIALFVRSPPAASTCMRPARRRSATAQQGREHGPVISHPTPLGRPTSPTTSTAP